MSKRALLVGIDKYDHVMNLTGCVADATAMRDVLRRNADGSPNYGCRLLTYGQSQSDTKITRAVLREACYELFDYTGDVLLYFSGHGALTKTGGYLATSDTQRNDFGIPMKEIIDLANSSSARDILLILDCCHSGDMGNALMTNTNPLALMRENMTVLAASLNSQPAMELNGHGVFTTAVLDALDGSAADHMGWVTAPSIYAYVERGFGEWVQRPVYKSHATELTIVRQCAPLISHMKLQELVEHFPVIDYKYQLDPEFEPEDEHGNVREPVNHEKVKIGQLFKEYRDVGLLKASIEGEQFYWVARRSHTVELTLRGREYWQLVKKDRI